MSNAQKLSIGEKLWNGVIVDAGLAQRYARAQQAIDAFKAEGLAAPEALLNARHKIIRDAI